MQLAGGSLQAKSYLDSVAEDPLEAAAQVEDVLGGAGRAWQLGQLLLHAGALGLQPLQHLQYSGRGLSMCCTLFESSLAR